MIESTSFSYVFSFNLICQYSTHAMRRQRIPKENSSVRKINNFHSLVERQHNIMKGILGKNKNREKINLVEKRKSHRSPSGKLVTVKSPPLKSRKTSSVEVKNHAMMLALPNVTNDANFIGSPLNQKLRPQPSEMGKSNRNCEAFLKRSNVFGNPSPWYDMISSSSLREILQMWAQQPILIDAIENDEQPVPADYFYNARLLTSRQRKQAVRDVLIGRPPVELTGFIKFLEIFNFSSSDTSDSNDFVSKLFHQIDKDGDGFVSLEDVLPVLSPPTSKLISSTLPLSQLKRNIPETTFHKRNRWLHFSKTWMYNNKHLPPHLSPLLN